MIIGIDPGFSGAIAFLSDKVLNVYNLPLKLVKNKKQIDGNNLSKLICDRIDFADIVYPDKLIAVIEDVHSMPRDGVVSAFSFGYNAGILLGVLETLNIKVLKVDPAVWKSALGLSRNKKDSLELAKKYFPNNKESFKRLKDDGKAEAALLAQFAKECL